MKLAISGAILCSILIPGAVSYAGDHDGGFFVRAAVGLNNGSSRLENEATGTVELSGFGFDAEGAAGWAVARNLAVHATAIAWRVYDPGIGKVGGSADGYVTFGGLGAGVTYYVMPANMYFSTSLAAARMNFWLDGVWSESGTGLAFEFMAGKEWFIGGGLGIGASVGVLYHTVPDGDIDARWGGVYLPVRFSATFN